MIDFFYLNKIRSCKRMHALLKKVKTLISKILPIHKNREGDVGYQKFSYEYIIYPYSEIFGEKQNGYNNFFLIGDNWLDCKEKPIAIVFGCNKWKYGFIADYLKEFRCAFAKRKLCGFSAIIILLRLKIKPCQILVWGYNEGRLLSIYFRLSGIEVWRIEDGFLRSADLGANHSTPYSLVVDKKGLYYNSRKESDIEYHLNNYCFDKKSRLLVMAEEYLDRFIEDKLSKYNLPTSLYYDTSINIKECVAILGQVKGDMSLKYGNPNKISLKKMIIVAKRENPNAEIIYRPHPEDYEKMQKLYKGQLNRKNFFKRMFYRRILLWMATNNIIISNPDEHISNFIDRVDKVYTISSLSALEALWRGKKVVVMGAPFYSGWGLTDDRVLISRRKRKISKVELFAMTYLLYPKYLADIENSYIGFMATYERIRVDREILLYEYWNKKFVNKDYKSLMKSRFFPKIFLLERLDGVKEYLLNINHIQYLNKNKSFLFEKIYCLMVFGLLQDDRMEDVFLTTIRQFISLNSYYSILTVLYKNYNKDYLNKHILWLKKQRVDFDIDLEVDMGRNISNLIYKEIYTFANQEEISAKGGEECTLSLKESEICHCDIVDKIRLLNNDSKFSSRLMMFMEELLEKNDTQQFWQLVEIMLVSRVYRVEIFSKILRVAYQNFKLKAVLELIELFSCILSAKDFGSLYVKILIRKSPKMNLQTYMYQSFYAFRMFNASFILLSERMKQLFPRDTDMFKVFERVFYMDRQYSVEQAFQFNSIGKHKKAFRILQDLIKYGLKNGVNHRVLVEYSRTLTWLGQANLAYSYIKRFLQFQPTTLLYNEAIDLNCRAGHFKQAFKLIEESCSKNIAVSPMLKRKTYFLNYYYQRGFDTLLEEGSVQSLIKFIGQKVLTSYECLERTREKKFLCIIPLSGPGDEIRFACLYKSIAKRFAEHHLTFGCLPKLEDLFKRSFPNIKLAPINRDIRGIEELSNFNQLPSIELTPWFDNNGYQKIQENDYCIITNLLFSYLWNDKDEFLGKPYLKADEIRIRYYQSRLPKNKKLVGLNWRSSLTVNPSRARHYFKIQELEKLFTIPDIQFVNCQYDECEEELEWVEKRFPGKMINIKELDQYNDLDGVAALLSCMDLVIAATTAVCELAGALGCKTWIFDASTEILHRKCDNGKSNQDMWHHSAEIIDVDERGNKEKLAQKIYTKLKGFSR